MPQAAVLASGMVERIGIEDGSISYKNSSKDFSESIDFPDHASGLKKIAELLMDRDLGVIESANNIDAVGHRIVHGGKQFTETTKVTEEVKANIRRLFSLAPLHNPAHLTGIEVAEDIFKSASQVCVFDTAFFTSIPQKVYHSGFYASIYRNFRSE